MPVSERSKILCKTFFLKIIMLVSYSHFHFKFRENQEPDIKKYNRIILHG